MNPLLWFLKIKKQIILMDKIDRLMIFVVVVSFIIRIAYLLFDPIRGWDESVYLNLGQDLAHNPYLYSLINSGWNDFIPSTDILYSWPNIGFRPPLLPYLIAIISALKLNFLIPLLVPILSTASVYLVYRLGALMFNKRAGLYASIFFCLVPLNIYTSEKIWVDAPVVFFVLLTFLSFWRGYERGEKKHKILFGLYLGLALLTRYTAMWIAPVFLIYFLTRDRSLHFMKDKYLWFAVCLFTILICPWLFYGYVYYHNPLGGFIHGLQAANYYGGIQAWSYYLERSWRIVSVLGPITIISLIYLSYLRELKNKGVYLLLIWGVLFSVMVMAMPHKEDRYILLSMPVVCLIVGYTLTKIRYQYIVLIAISIILAYTSWIAFKIEYVSVRDKSSICFMEANNFIKNNLPKNVSIVSQQSPVVYYYTKKNILAYPKEWSIENLKVIINSNNDSSLVYLYYTSYDEVLGPTVKGDLDENFTKVFECEIDYGFANVYK